MMELSALGSVLRQSTGLFLAEVLVRTAIIYLGLLVVVRRLGKRMSRQLSKLELAVMVALGAIVSGPGQVEDRGVLGAFVLLLVAAARGPDPEVQRCTACHAEHWTPVVCTGSSGSAA